MRLTTQHLVLSLFLSMALPPPAAVAQGTLATLNGAAGGDLAGWSVADAGDVDQDGFPDVLVGAKVGKLGVVATGWAKVYSGLDQSLLHELYGSAYSDFFGFAVSTAGDLDGDGAPDFLVGAPQEDLLLSDDGTVRAYSGATGAVLFTWSGPRSGADFGSAVADAGDVDLDGFPDVVVGSWTDYVNGPFSGSAYVYSGRDGSQLFAWLGDAAGDELAFAVAGAGDTNNDGYADVIVAVLDDDNTVLDAGGARLFSGQDGAILHQWDGDSTADWYGYSVAGIGDVDLDGHDDLLVGAPRDDNNGPDSGMVRAFSGQNYSLLFQVDGPSGSRLGWSVADTGDVNQDGVPDVLLAAPWYASQRGAVYVASGAGGQTLATIDSSSYSNFGYFVSSAQDVNQDGTAEVLIGAPYDDAAGSNAGAAHLVSLVCGEVLAYGSGCAGSGGFVPELTMNGCFTPGGHGTVAIDKGLGGAVTFLLVGSGTNSVNIGPGCPLIVAPFAPPVLVSFALDGSGPGNGSKTFEVRVDPFISGPLARTLQALVIDPAGTGGYATSNGIQVTVF